MISSKKRFGATGKSALAAWLAAFWMVILAPLSPATGTYPVAYIVLFDVGSAEPTGFGREVIGQFTSDFKMGPPETILLSCHADRTGSEAFNFKLSERRCHAVRHILIESGISRDLIVLWPRGELAPVVLTPDGADHPANRVVVIDQCQRVVDGPCRLPRRASGYLDRVGREST